MRGLLVIGHGSRRAEANATVRALAAALAAQPAPAERAARPAWDRVAPAFLDVARPDIADGYTELVAAGCTEIIAHPFFLFAGTHTARDIPAALAAAQARHPGTTWTLTEPLGLHPGVVAAVRDRVSERLAAEHPGPAAQPSGDSRPGPA
ncbi:MAG: CbiX/SirB N-terminal domain-containing protein [Frankia sp.]|nr:CbiX/SirB N-terminal domain-containing protein [Frankia sp.]